MDKSINNKIQEYCKFFFETNEVQEIDHIDDESFIMLAELQPNYDYSGIIFMEGGMGISFGAFSTLYPMCSQIIKDTEDLNEDDFREQYEDINLASRILLCLNGEINAAFNRRLRLLQLDMIFDLEEELHFLNLIHVKFKKSSISWFYRRCVAKKYVSLMDNDKKLVINFLDNEEKFLNSFFTKHARNYYGWSYKKFLLEEILIEHNLEDELVRYFLLLKDFCERNIHDYSAFHMLQFMYSKLGKNVRLENELEWIDELVLKFDLMYSMEKADKTFLSKTRYFELEAARKHMAYLQDLIKS
jgi:Protein prenyltransferase alpha subunit repeat